MRQIDVYFDGSYGNGTAAYGFVVKIDGEVRREVYGRVGSGPEQSSNTAEYEALYQAMQFVKEHYPDEKVTFCGDSTLVINQMNGVANAKKGLYLPYFHKANGFAMRDLWSFEWIPRAFNSEADELSQYRWTT